MAFYCRFYDSGCTLYFSFPDSGNVNYFSFDSRNAKSIQQATSQLCLPEWLIKTNWITLWLHVGTPWSSPTNSRFKRVFLCFYLSMNSVAWLEGMFAQPGAQYMKSWGARRRLEKEAPRLRYQGTFRIEFGEYVCWTKSLLRSPSLLKGLQITSTTSLFFYLPKVSCNTWVVDLLDKCLLNELKYDSMSFPLLLQDHLSADLGGEGNLKNRDFQTHAPHSQSSSSTEEARVALWNSSSVRHGWELDMQTMHRVVKTGEKLTRDGTHLGLNSVSLKGPKRTNIFWEKEHTSSYHPIIIQTLRARLIFPIYFRIINWTD